MSEMLHFYGLLCGVHPFSWSQKHSQLQDGAVISKSLLMDLQFFCSTHFPFHARSECRLLKNPILCCQVPNRRPCMASVPCLLLHRKMFNYLEILLLVLPVLMMHRWYLGKQKGPSLERASLRLQSSSSPCCFCWEELPAYLKKIILFSNVWGCFSCK